MAVCCWSAPRKGRGRALVCLALACAVLAGGLVACEQTQNSGPDQAVEELEDTITYDGQTVSFTLRRGSGTGACILRGGLRSNGWAA